MKTALIRKFLDARRQPLAASAETTKGLDELCQQVPKFCAQLLTDRTTHANVLRFAADTDKAREVLCFLAGLGFDGPEPARKPWLVVPWLKKPEKTEFTFADESLRQSAAARRSLEAGKGMPRETLFGIRGTYHKQAPNKLVRRLSAPRARSGRVDGSLTAAIKEVLTGANGVTSFADIVAKTETTRSRTVNVTVSVVLDLSGSAV
jgi:hypothetical protein